MPNTVRGSSAAAGHGGGDRANVDGHAVGLLEGMSRLLGKTIGTGSSV